MMHELTRPLKTWLMGALIAGALFGCEDPTFTTEQASPFVATWATQFGPKLKAEVTSGDTSELIKTTILAAREKESKRLKQTDPLYASILDELYAAREHKPAFIQGGELTPAGKAVLAQLERVHEDGFSPAPYRLKSIKEDIAKLSELKTKLESFGDFEVSEQARALIVEEVLTKNPEEFVLDESAYAELDETFKSSAEGDALREQVEQINALGQDIALTQANIEVLLGLGLGRYANEMRYFRYPDVFVHPREDDIYNNPNTRSKRPPEARGAYEAGKILKHAAFTAERIIKTRKDELITADIKAFLGKAMTTKEVKPLLATLSPGPQYEGIRKEYVRYTAIADAGGWPKLTAQKRLRKGAKKEIVKQLKERLKIEGFFPQDKESTTLFDADLVDAVKAYQRTHQMGDDGKPGKAFWRSVNVSAQARAAQLKATLKKWRASNIRHHDDETYVIVNLPDFTAEIWHEQARAKRMRVVIGNNDRVRDEESGKMEHANRTPTLSAYIDRVIYSPYWNVTPRIRNTEILVDVRKDLAKVYTAKVDRLLGKTTPPAQTSPPAAGTTPPPVAVAQKPYSKSGGQWTLDIAAFNAAYQAKTGAAADVKALFPYLTDAGTIDVSTTDPNNIPPWYAKNGYEVMYPSKSWEYVRQLNGAANALGKVKVIFPNLHDVYLHDTPAKALFKKTIRAYSHGCMRMHEPLEFAEWLLKNDGQYSPEIKRKLSSSTYHPIYLKTHVPVHVVYFTTRVDDEGRANFLIDIYNKEPS